MAPVARYWVEGQVQTAATAKGPFTGNATSYTRSNMCGAPANTTGWFEPGRLNYVYVTLPLGTTIFYQLGTAVRAKAPNPHFILCGPVHGRGKRKRHAPLPLPVHGRANAKEPVAPWRFFALYHVPSSHLGPPPRALVGRGLSHVYLYGVYMQAP